MAGRTNFLIRSLFSIEAEGITTLLSAAVAPAGGVGLVAGAETSEMGPVGGLTIETGGVVGAGVTWLG